MSGIIGNLEREKIISRVGKLAKTKVNHVTKGGHQILLCGFCPLGGYPPSFTDKIFSKKKVTDLGGTPPHPLYGHSPEKCSSKSAKNGVFSPKNTCFWFKK